MNFITELNSQTILQLHINGYLKLYLKSKKIAYQIEFDNNWYLQLRIIYLGWLEQLDKIFLDRLFVRKEIHIMPKYGQKSLLMLETWKLAWELWFAIRLHNFFF